jgi:serine/threonine protein kinase
MHEDHPTTEQLRTYATGHGDAAVVEEHLAVCTRYWQVVEETEAAMPLVRILQSLAVSGRGGDVPFPPAELQNHPRYRLLGYIGGGGMGQVWKARHLVMDRIVAIKVVHPPLVGSADRVARFRREAQAVARLDDPNVVRSFDAEECGGLLLLVMEYVEGTDLDQLVRERGPLPAAEADDYVRQAALGLGHAHAAGIIHRDVKPSYILRTPTGQVKLLDFGLASLRQEAQLSPVTDSPPVRKPGFNPWDAAVLNLFTWVFI